MARARQAGAQADIGVEWGREENGACLYLPVRVQNFELKVKEWGRTSPPHCSGNFPFLRLCCSPHQPQDGLTHAPGLAGNRLKGFNGS